MLETHPPKERIRREAMRLFVEHGVDAVSMRDIADAVGMKAPSLYAHFRGRDELIGDLFHASYAEYGRQLAEAAASPGTFRQQLEAMVRTICALHAEDELLFNFLLLTQHGSLRQFPENAHNPVEIICRHIAGAMQAGDIPPGNPTLVAAAIIGVVVQTATFKLYGRMSQGLAALTDEIVALCLRIVS
ncbi:MAG TPA: TetR/AcrR family transcriptional regulator [Rhodopila sp.]|jgi:AcrR family transcriptional regulator|nr:TetR/AcrR family transcriptional regulator [Rhodopila sp.]